MESPKENNFFFFCSSSDESRKKWDLLKILIKNNLENTRPLLHFSKDSFSLHFIFI